MFFETGVPLPERGNRLKYPFGELPVGGSFVVEVEESDLRRMQQCLSACSRSYGRSHGVKFATRIVRDGRVGVGVWRVE